MKAPYYSIYKLRTRIEEYRAKLKGEAEMDERVLADANGAHDVAIGKLDVMRSARRLEYFNELFPVDDAATLCTRDPNNCAHSFCDFPKCLGQTTETRG